MSQENVEIARRMYADFGLYRRRVEAAARAGLIAPNAEFDYSALYPDGPVFQESKPGATTGLVALGALPQARARAVLRR